MTMAATNNSSGFSRMPPPKVPARSAKPLARSATTEGPSVPVSSLLMSTNEPVPHRTAVIATSSQFLNSSPDDPRSDDRMPTSSVTVTSSVLPSATVRPVSVPAALVSACREASATSQANYNHLRASNASTSQMAGLTSSPYSDRAADLISTPTATNTPANAFRADLIAAPSASQIIVSSITTDLSQPTQATPRLPVTSLLAQVSAPSATSSESDSMAEFVKSLREEPSLYKLPPDELEGLVASIVREDGFMQLVVYHACFVIEIWADSLTCSWSLSTLCGESKHSSAWNDCNTIRV